MHVILAGGGTAGHIEPALNLADALRRRDSSIGITALGTDRGLETELVPARGYELSLIPATPLPRRPSADLLTLPRRMRAAIKAVEEVIDATSADVVVGFGGYVALPAYLAARRRGTPMVVHEANARPGLANKVGARFTPFVAETVRGSMSGAELIGLPLRPAIATLDRAAKREEGAAAFDLDPLLPTLLAFGGSQGARSLNAAIESSAGDLAEAGIQVLQSVGNRNELPTDLSPHPKRVALSYVDRMDLAYAAADLALCRAGAMTVAELTAVGLPAAYVPLPIGNGEQRLNAEPVVRSGGGLLVDDVDLGPAWIRTHVIPLMLDSHRLAAASAAASALGRRHADEQLTDLVMRAATRQQAVA